MNRKWTRRRSAQRLKNVARLLAANYNFMYGRQPSPWKKAR